MYGGQSSKGFLVDHHDDDSTLPIYRGREQHGEGREAEVKGTGSRRAVYGRREVLTPLSPPPLIWALKVKMFLNSL